MAKKNKDVNIHLVFVDMDGVLADCTHRLKYAEKKDYEKFYSEEEMMKDEPIAANINTINAMTSAMQRLSGEGKGLDACLIVALSGRPQRTVSTTKQWMKKYNSGFENAIDIWAFRRDHDFRPSEVVKAEGVMNVLATIDKYYSDDNDANVHASFTIIDDDPKNIKAIKEEVKKNIPSLTDNAFCCLTVGTNRL